MMARNVLTNDSRQFMCQDIADPDLPHQFRGGRPCRRFNVPFSSGVQAMGSILSVLFMGRTVRNAANFKQRWELVSGRFDRLLAGRVCDWMD
jgi:hypothetical protein